MHDLLDSLGRSKDAGRFVITGDGAAVAAAGDETERDEEQDEDDYDSDEDSDYNKETKIED